MRVLNFQEMDMGLRNLVQENMPDLLVKLPYNI